jgi:hypothetical protein
MNRDPFGKHVKGYYSSQTLSPEKLQALMSIEVPEAEAAGQLSSWQITYWMARWRFQRNLSIAAGLLLLVVGTFQLQSLMAPAMSSLPYRVAQEIALNHNKQLANEFEVTTFSKLAALMIKLDFIPHIAKRVELLDYHMTGGRYCSIQGQLAAQVRLIGEQEKEVTLYQAQLNKELATLQESEYVVDGVNVQLWLENGRLFGLAESAL